MLSAEQPTATDGQHSPYSDTMAETNEKIFSLEEIDYQRFWGQNDRMLDFVRLLFPKLKLIVRGEMLKALGPDDELQWFEGKLQAMMTYYDKFGHLTENAVMQIMERRCPLL